MNDEAKDPYKTFHDGSQEGEEERKKEKIAYIYTYIRNISSIKSTPSPAKKNVLLSVPRDVHEAAKFMAPLFHTTISNLYVEGLLKHLEYLAPRLPTSIQLTLVQGVPKDQQTDSMLELEVEWMRDQLRPHVDKLKKIKPTPQWRDLTKSRFSREQIQRLLPKAIRLVRRSRDQDLERLVFEARELLRV